MKRYSTFLLSGVLLSLLFVSAFNWMINPYDIFPSPDIKGLNYYKSEVGRHTRLSKVYQVEKIKPDAILLASSRGMVIPEGYFSDDEMTGFNFSLTSASTYELFRVLQHAQTVKPLKRVILALDEVFTETAQNNFSENRLAVNPDGSVNRMKWQTTWKDVFFSLLSIDSLRSSIRTIRKQGEYQEMMNTQLYASRRIFNASGHRQMFRTMESSIFSDFKGSAHNCPSLIPASTSETIEAESAKIFEKIVAFSYSHDIELYIYISPTHARLYEVNCMLGRWHELENVKRQVVNIVDRQARINNRKAYSVWDFSGYNTVTMEEVPEFGDKDSMMAWYWEDSHYTKETARVLLNKIFGINESDVDFGVRISVSNIENHLLDIRQQRNGYINRFGKDVTELRDLFDKVKLKRKALK